MHLHPEQAEIHSINAAELTGQGLTRGWADLFRFLPMRLGANYGMGEMFTLSAMSLTSNAYA